MSVSIVVFYIITLVGAVVLAFQKLPERDFGLSLKLGLAIAVVGFGLGFLMPTVNAARQAALAAGQEPALTIVGAHTVGAFDGSPGLPFLGWSTTHGDLRIGHFIGIHGAQVLPLLGFWLSRRRRWPLWSRFALVWMATSFYLGIVGLVTWQALRGQSVVTPDALPLGAVAALIVVTALVIVGIWLLSRRDGPPAGRAKVT